MKCEICHENPATIHIHEVTPDAQRIIHICKSCAQKKNAGEDTGLNLVEMICGGDREETSVPQTELSCPQCHWTLARFRKVGRLGCAACWNVFRTALDEGLPTVHRGTSHTGLRSEQDWTPCPEHENAVIQAQITGLQKELDQCVRQEAYEKAVEIRDRIADLKQKMTDDSHE